MVNSLVFISGVYNGKRAETSVLKYGRYLVIGFESAGECSLYCFVVRSDNTSSFINMIFHTNTDDYPIYDLNNGVIRVRRYNGSPKISIWTRIIKMSVNE